MRRRVACCVVAGALAGLTWGCSSDDGETDPVDQAPPLPTLDELPAGWSVIEPGGDTICGRGAPYAFFVRPGTVNKVLLEFEGGGACWSAGTCSVEADLFSDIVDRTTMDTPEGLHDHDNAQNPFADWHHVFVGNCTGDLMIGSKTTGYGDFEVHHMGQVNAEVVVDWVYENFPSPERMVLTGCSAGGYASLDWAPWVMQHYGDMPVVQLADCAAGVQPGSILAIFNGVWGVEHLTPSFIPALADPDWLTLELHDVYIGDAGHFPDQTFGQYNTQYDVTQTSYFEDMGGSGVEEWSQKMNESIATINAAASNFSSFTASGSDHCIVNKPEIYTVQSGGVALLDWMADLANGTAVDDVHCDTDCGAPSTD